MIYRYGQEVHDFVRENCKTMRDRKLAEECNKALGTHFTASSMKAFRGNHKYNNGFGKALSKQEIMERKYPKGMYEFIRDNSWGVSSARMAELVKEKFGYEFTKDGMKQFRQRHGIKSGEKGWFQKGHEPWNKGKKLEDYLPPERVKEVRERIQATQFKPGSKPVNTLPVGSISIIDGYKLIKIKESSKRWDAWEFYHRQVWKEHYGEIPEGMCISFKDSDPMNCDISNLMMITKAENVRLAKLGYRSTDPAITETALSLVRLEHEIMRKEKEEK